MVSKQINRVKKEDIIGNLDKPKKSLPIKLPSNVNSSEQIQLLLHLLLRAREKKLDILGVVWEDVDLGKGNYFDYFDLPKQELADMLEEMKRMVDLI